MRSGCEKFHIRRQRGKCICIRVAYISVCTTYICARATRLNRRPSQQAFPAVHRAPLHFPVLLPFHPVGVELLINPFVCPQVGILELCGPTCAGSMPGPSARIARRVSTAYFCVGRCLGLAKLHFPSSHSILLPFCRSCHLRCDRNSIIYCCYILTTHLAIFFYPRIVRKA